MKKMSTLAGGAPPSSAAATFEPAVSLAPGKARRFPPTHWAGELVSRHLPLLLLVRQNLSDDGGKRGLACPPKARRRRGRGDRFFRIDSETSMEPRHPPDVVWDNEQSRADDDGRQRAALYPRERV